MPIFYRLLSLFIIIISFYSCKDDDNNYTPVYAEGEEFLTAHLSVNSTSNNAFGHAIDGLTLVEESAFGSGNSLFNTSWVSSPASTTSIDGLGPTFNSRACASCHLKDGRGKPPSTKGQNSSGFLVRLSLSGQNPHGGPVAVPFYGDQLQDRANIGISYEAKTEITYELISGTYPDGTAYELRKPTYTFYDEQFGSLSGVLISPRVGQQVIGLGLIDALSEQEILSNEDEFDADNDGISGKANYVWDAVQKTTKIGRFGWKANQPNLRQQIAGALNGDMGLTTSIFKDANCPDPQNSCQTAANGGDPEVTDKQLDAFHFYQSALAVPKRRNYKEENVLNGKALFTDVGCVKCHATDLRTATYSFNKHLENISIHPYSDFLLHDMGAELADNRPDFKATGSEWRTQPLWGIGLIETVNKHTFLLHDGRARNIEEAILWHGGEAEKTKSKFMKLSSKEREDIIAFINSL